MSNLTRSKKIKVKEGRLDAFPWAYGKEFIKDRDEHFDGVVLTKILNLGDGLLELWLFNEPLLFTEAMFQIAALRAEHYVENWRLPSRQELVFIREELSLKVLSGTFWCSDILDYRPRLTYRTLSIDLATMKILGYDHEPGPHQLLAVRAYT